jgi:hypothetical protein
MRTYADLTAPSPSYPSQTVAQRAVARMQNTTTPMPPAPSAPATAAEIATMQNWVNAGTPMGACGSVDAGSGDAGTPTNTASCTSGRFFTPTPLNTGSDMDPGMACIGCHSLQGGPRFQFAGTVYPTAHEPDLCDGTNASGTLSVVVTDANGLIVTANVNSAGNFEYSGVVRLADGGFTITTLATPFQVKVTNGTTSRAMVSKVSIGDCNSCHTQAGTSGAPGRIMGP